MNQKFKAKNIPIYIFRFALDSCLYTTTILSQHKRQGKNIFSIFSSIPRPPCRAPMREISVKPVLFLPHQTPKGISRPQWRIAETQAGLTPSILSGMPCAGNFRRFLQIPLSPICAPPPITTPPRTALVWLFFQLFPTRSNNSSMRASMICDLFPRILSISPPSSIIINFDHLFSVDRVRPCTRHGAP